VSQLPEETGALAAELRRLPTPMPSPALVERVRRIAHLELASRADEKLNRLVLVFLLVFSWTLALVGFFAVRVVAAGTVSVLGIAALQGSSLSWSVVYFGAAWVSGAILFVVLGVQYRKSRSVV
jgi:hypothetical protein